MTADLVAGLFWTWMIPPVGAAVMDYRSVELRSRSCNQCPHGVEPRLVDRPLGPSKRDTNLRWYQAFDEA